MPTTNHLNPWREYQHANRMARRIMLRLPDGLYEQIKSQAEENMVSVTEMIRVMARDWLDSEPKDSA